MSSVAFVHGVGVTLVWEWNHVMRVLERKLVIIAIGVADLQGQLSLPFSLHWGKQQNPQEVSWSEDVQLREFCQNGEKHLQKWACTVCFHPATSMLLYCPSSDRQFITTDAIVHSFCYAYLSDLSTNRQLPPKLSTCIVYTYTYATCGRGFGRGDGCGLLWIDYHTICPYFAFLRYSIKPVFSVHSVLNTPEYIHH